MIMGRRMRVMRFAMIVMAMAPQHQLFQNEKNEDAEQDGRSHPVRIAVLERVREDLEEGRPSRAPIA